MADGGRLLIAHRFPEAHLPDLWEFPGGKTAPGETPEACAVREAAEELGIRIEIVAPLLRRPYDYADRKVDLRFFVGRIVDGSPRAIGCREWRWVTPEELPSYRLPDASEPVVEALREGGWLPSPRTRAARVVSKRLLAPEVTELTLRPEDPAGETFRAGQHLWIETDEKIRRPYSIASPPSHRERLVLILNRIPSGAVSNYLADLDLEDRVVYTGPCGSFTVRERPDRDLLFVATGTGLAPLRSMILDLLDRRVERPIDLLFGTRRQQDLLYPDEFRRLESRHRNFRYHPCLSRPGDEGWTGHRGRVTTVLPVLFPDLRRHETYLCGREEMVREVRDLLPALGLEPTACHREGG